MNAQATEKKKIFMDIVDRYIAFCSNTISPEDFLTLTAEDIPWLLATIRTLQAQLSHNAMGWKFDSEYAARASAELSQLRSQLAAERAATAVERPVKVRIGTSCLTRDLVWCECQRGLSLTGFWEFCPRCGGKIDQESYLSACQEALRHGATLYRDVEEVEEILRLNKAVEAAPCAPSCRLNFPDLDCDSREWEPCGFEESHCRTHRPSPRVCDCWKASARKAKS